ncbi:MAG: KamA family radical SAM protein [Candidatus Syntrophoarchaeum sp.]|nr:KamA family radical SAM protein [Candidatus Syntrophoarchaeum sp.]
MGKEMDWGTLLRESAANIRQLSLYYPVEKDAAKVTRKYPMRINPYYLSLIKEREDAIWKQSVPDLRELEDEEGVPDPLHEENDSPVAGLVHRYPDRVLLLVSNRCAMYCRFCTRKRGVGDPFKRIKKEQVLKGIEYIREHEEIRDVLISGGDPLLLKDEELAFFLERLKEIKHVEVLRIGTRVACSLPQRITDGLVSLLRRYHPLYINTHFNHPGEFTEESRRACSTIADAGIPLGDQTVLLRGINDSVDVMNALIRGLWSMRVTPYYIYQADLTKGTKHFRTDVDLGIEIFKRLKFHPSLPMPHFVIDAPGGGGKIPITPECRFYDVINGDGIEVLNLDYLEYNVLKSRLEDAGDKGAGIIVIELREIEKNKEDKGVYELLKQNHPLYINMHLNHPDELTEDVKRVAPMLCDAGVPLGDRINLIEGVNNDPKVIKELAHELLKLRVKPYYLHADSEEDGLAIVNSLRGFTTGMAVPHLVVGDRIISPNYIVEKTREKIVLRNYQGRTFEYPNTNS